MNTDTLVAGGATIIAAAFGLWQGVRADRIDKQRLLDQEAHDADEKKLSEARDAQAIRDRIDGSIQAYLRRLEERIATLERRLVDRDILLDKVQTERRAVEEKLDRAEMQIRHLESENRQLKGRVAELEAKLGSRE